MVSFILMTVLLIGATQLGTASPLGLEKENDPAKQFSADELQLAKNAGLSNEHLIGGKAAGFTLDEMIKLKELKEKTENMTTFEHTSKMCGILIPGHKTSSNYSNAHEESLRYMMKTRSYLPDEDYAHFLRTKVCAYVSQPN